MKTAWTIGGVIVGFVALASVNQVLGSPTVPARTPPDPVAVSLDGLDLSQASDAELALRRLESAAARACTGGSRSAEPDQSATACEAAALAKAVAAIAAPRLTVAHRVEARALKRARW